MRIILIVATLHLAAFAQNSSVAIDVSGSMAKYGKWQPDVLALIEHILAGESVDPAAFEATGDKAALEKFHLGQGQTLHFVPFGNADLDSLPYFNGVTPVGKPSGLAGVFPLTPAAFKASNTNKPLAIAVAANLAGFDKGEARLLVVSDFLVDSNLDNAQQQYVNQFESNAQIETPVIFSWRKDRRVQLKLINVRATSPSVGKSAATASGNPTATVQLISAKVVPNPQRVQFSWRASDPNAFQSYSLLVKEAGTRKNAFSRASLLGISAVWPDPPSGKYSWQITGTLADGTQISSASGQFEVEGGGAGVILLALAAMAAIGGGLWWFNSRRGHKQKDFEEQEGR